MRRSLGVMKVQRYIDKPYSWAAESKNRHLIEKLKLSVTFNDNIHYIFSYLLHGHESGLTEEQYTSLHMLHDIIRKRMVNVYNMLHVLPKLEHKNKNQQTTIILSSLVKSLPIYLSCAAKFLIGEIRLKRIDLNAMLRPTRSERFNYLANIDRDSIVKSKMKDIGERTNEYDKYSKVTPKALGPIFVKLFHILHTNNEFLSQELFGLILINLPNYRDDPVLEENIRFLYEVTMSNYIINWNLIVTNWVSKDAYALVFSVLFKIFSNPSTDVAVKSAASYVYNHLKITASAYANPDFKYTYDLIKQDIDVGLLLSAVVPQEFDENAVRMKNRLLKYFMQSQKNKDLYQALKGFNKFAYDDPLDLLMAFLTRILNRIPASIVEIQQPAAALLSALIIKKYTRVFTPFVSPEIDVLVLLASLRNPDLHPILVKLVDSITFELTSHPRISVTLSALIPTEKDKCLIPRQCLINTFQKIQRLQTQLPITLIAKIQNILYILQTTTSPHTFSEQYSLIPGNIDRYKIDQNSPAILNDMHSASTEKEKYMWDINKYVVDSGTHKESTEQGPENPTIIEPLETKEPVVLNSLHNWTSTSPQIFYGTTHLTTTERIPWKDFSSEIEYSHTLEPISSVSPNSSQNVFPTVPKQPLEPEEDLEHVTHIAPYTSMSPRSTEEILQNTATKRSVEETLDHENVSTAMMLPPLIEPNRPLKISLFTNGVPIVTTEEHNPKNDTKTELTLPEIGVLLKPPDVNNFLRNVDTPIVTQVLRPLTAIFGKNYISKILMDVNPKLYPTNIALLTAILKRAKNHPQVAKMPELISLIQRYITSMEYVAPAVLLPIVISIKRFTSNIVYSTFSLHDLTYSTISENPPDDSSPDTVTVPLVNPKIWLQAINPSDPYVDLLPTLPKGDAFEKKLRPLKDILTHEKIVRILGPDFKPLLYQNKGALLITLLYKLQKVKRIQLIPQLKSIIDLYIRAIQIPSMNTNVSESIFGKMISESTGHWQPELTSLIYALPVAKNEAEIAMSRTIEDFLAGDDLLEKLHIAKPPLIMSRGKLLRQIILKVLSSNMHLEKRVLKALRYYKDKVMLVNMGALPIMWMWVRVYVVKAEVKLSDMIQNTLNFDKLSYQEKLAYNNFVTYLAENPHFLQNNDYFAFEKYKTQGEFVKAFLKYLLKKQQISSHIKRDVHMLLPRVALSGSGAILIPNFSKFF